MLNIKTLALSTFIACSAFVTSTGAVATEIIGPKVCAAVRGNGAKIFVHFHALAKIHEQYGMLWGTSGGSSGSVTSFLLDSIYSNPLLTQCEGKNCDPQEVAARAALLLKSLESYPVVLSEFPESSAFFIAATAIPDLRAAGLPELFATQPDRALTLFKQLLGSPKYASLINPEVLESINRSANPVALSQDIITGIHESQVWAVNSEVVFLRPGLTSFPVLAEYFGRLGSFYAADGTFANRPGMLDFFKYCATPGRDRPWTDVALLKTPSGTCGSNHAALLKEYYRQSKQLGDQAPKRSDYTIGTGLHILTSFTQIEGETVAMWREARKQYLNQSPLSWKPNFKDWSIAYSGRSTDLDLLLKNTKQFTDFKTERARVIKDLKWKDVLEHSPAEPAFSRALEIKGGTVTTGGWSDGQPAQALKNIGCDKVIAFESQYYMDYQIDMVKYLGGSKAEADRLFSMSDKESGLAVAIQNTDALWCSNFSATNFKSIQEMSAMGWNATLQTDDPYFLKPNNNTIRLNSDRKTYECYPQ